MERPQRRSSAHATAVACALALLTAACTGSAGVAQSDGRELQAVATVYPLTWMAEEIAPDAQVTSFAAQGQDPHDLELTPQQRVLLESADVVAYLGDVSFQPQVERAVAGARGQVVDVAQIVGEDALRTYTVDAHDEPDGDVHGEAGVDPHVWFDPGLMAEVALGMGAAFAAADPSHAPAYRARAQAVARELEQLEVELAAMLGDCAFDEVIVSHEAYAYLLAPHGLEQHGISSAGAHDAATPGALAELVAEVRAQAIPAVLTEPVEGRDDAEVVAREAGVELIEIYSLDIVDDEQARRGYPRLLREQAEAVAAAAACHGGGD